MSKRVFISYAHESNEHCSRVLALAQRLRRDGVDAWLDRFAPHQSDWALWMGRELDKADAVLCVCTETWRRRYDAHEDDDLDAGARYEGRLLRRYALRARGNAYKIVAVAFSQEDRSKYVPRDFSSGIACLLDDEYERMYACLTGRSLAELATLGGVRPLSQVGEAQVLSEGANTTQSPSPEELTRINNDIIDELIEAYADKPEIKLLLQRIGMSVASINLDGSSRVVWHQVWPALERAALEGTLLAEVLNDPSVAAYHDELRRLWALRGGNGAGGRAPVADRAAWTGVDEVAARRRADVGNAAEEASSGATVRAPPPKAEAGKSSARGQRWRSVVGLAVVGGGAMALAFVGIVGVAVFVFVWQRWEDRPTEQPDPPPTTAGSPAPSAAGQLPSKPPSCSGSVCPDPEGAGTVPKRPDATIETDGRHRSSNQPTPCSSRPLFQVRVNELVGAFGGMDDEVFFSSSFTGAHKEKAVKLCHDSYEKSCFVERSLPGAGEQLGPEHPLGPRSANRLHTTCTQLCAPTKPQWRPPVPESCSGDGLGTKATTMGGVQGRFVPPVSGYLTLLANYQDGQDPVHVKWTVGAGESEIIKAVREQQNPRATVKVPRCTEVRIALSKSASGSDSTGLKWRPATPAERCLEFDESASCVVAANESFAASAREQRLKYAEHGCEKNNLEACVLRGQMATRGDPPDFDKARTLFQTACTGGGRYGDGVLEGCMELASLMQREQGDPVDLVAASSVLAGAACRGLGPAGAELGTLGGKLTSAMKRPRGCDHSASGGACATPAPGAPRDSRQTRRTPPTIPR